jgi:hypothetical protein
MPTIAQATISLLIGITLTLIPKTLEAKPVHYDLNIAVTEGKLKGQKLTGEIHFDDQFLDNQGNGLITSAQGLEVNLFFFGKLLTNKDDVSYPDYPQLQVKNREIQRLEFWVEPGERRGSWWNRPGWKIEITPKS